MNLTIYLIHDTIPSTYCYSHVPEEKPFGESSVQLLVATVPYNLMYTGKLVPAHFDFPVTVMMWYVQPVESKI